MGVFDYQAGDIPLGELTSGRIVNIPFKGRQIKGMVVKIKNESDFENIKPVLSPDSTLTAVSVWQRELINWFSQYYHYSLSSTLELFLPAVPKRKVESKPLNKVEIQRGFFFADEKIKKFAEQIIAEKNKKKFLFLPCDLQNDYAFYSEMAGAVIRENRQALILFPRKDALAEFCRFLPEKLRAAATIFTSGSAVSKNDYFRRWREINDGQKKLILGTRSAVFAPFCDLGLIIVCESHSEDYKQYDQTPRYEAVNVAKKIQKLLNCALILSSQVPRIEDAYRAREENYSLVSLPRERPRPIRIINLLEESKIKFTYLSAYLIDKIKETLSLNKKALLIVNKKGEFSHNFCEDCGFEAICPECKLPYVFENGKLNCYHCKINQTAFAVCPKCGGANFKQFGVGIKSIANELKKIFGGAVAIENDDIKKCRLVLVSNMQNIAPKFFRDVVLLGFVYVDSLIHLADFNSNYKLYSNIKSLACRFLSFCPEGEIVAQTFFPESGAFKNLNNDFKDFYNDEISARRNYCYPPFSVLLKLIFQHHDEKIAEREASELREKLQSKFKNQDVNISEPYRHYASRVRKRFRFQIAVFLPFDSKIESELVREIPDYWIIDKNPIDLL